MPSRANKLSQFWQDLKRRNVVRVITVYAGAAFVIIELINNITEPLHLPEWTPTLVIVLLAIGFPVVIIFSWLFDIHPEKGMVKTEVTDHLKEQDAPKSTNTWKIASYISFVVILGLVVLNVIPHSDKFVLDKSIAVLPFINDSEDESNEHIINGIMDEILINLQAIKDLRVPGRTSVEQYRNNPKSIPEIASELKVAYIVAGSGQRYGNRIRLRVQLIEGKNDSHVWADSYDEVIEEPKDIFHLQSKIAQSIASELQALITPEEKNRIEKIPTNSLTATDFYLQAQEQRWKYYLEADTAALSKAQELYYKTLEYDSSYAQAYCGLAVMYWQKIGNNLNSEELDSLLSYINTALAYDDQLSEAFRIRGQYYLQFGNTEQAIRDLDRAVQLNPNDWLAYGKRGEVYQSIDLLKSLEDYHYALSLHRGDFLPLILRFLGNVYNRAGFKSKADFYSHESYALDRDSMNYTLRSAFYEETVGNFENALNLYKRYYAQDTSNIYALWYIGNIYVYLEQYDMAIEWFRRLLKHPERPAFSNVVKYNRIGLAYWHNGYKEDARKYFDKHVDILTNLDELGRTAGDPCRNAYEIAGVQAFLGEPDDVYEKLRQAGLCEKWDRYMRMLVNNDAMFRQYKEDHVFQSFVKDVEVKYLTEHERIRQWLEENGML
jgi:TolB-like protein/Tfp pilus assembly protein PilF